MTGASRAAHRGEPTLARRLGPFDATMIVMGGIIGAGIFVNPSVVARAVHTPALVLGAWVIGGVIANSSPFAEWAVILASDGLGRISIYPNVGVIFASSPEITIFSPAGHVR